MDSLYNNVVYFLKKIINPNISNNVNSRINLLASCALNDSESIVFNDAWIDGSKTTETPMDS